MRTDTYHYNNSSSHIVPSNEAQCALIKVNIQEKL